MPQRQKWQTDSCQLRSGAFVFIKRGVTYLLDMKKGTVIHLDNDDLCVGDTDYLVIEDERTLSHFHFTKEGKKKYICGGECVVKAIGFAEIKKSVINYTNTMSNVTTFIKKITRTEPEKTFVSVGFLNENEEITADGRSALEYILWNENKEALKGLADEIVKENGK